MASHPFTEIPVFQLSELPGGIQFIYDLKIFSHIISKNIFFPRNVVTYRENLNMSFFEKQVILVILIEKEETSALTCTRFSLE